MYIGNKLTSDLVNSGNLDSINLSDLENLAYSLKRVSSSYPVKTLTYTGYIHDKLAKVINYLITERILGIEVIDFNKCIFAKDTLKIIFNNLDKVEQINTIKIIRTNLRDSGLIFISKNFVKFPNLKTLDFSYNQSSKKSIKQLFKSLNFTKVTNLRLISNQLGIELSKELQNFLNNNEYLENLDISINQVGEVPKIDLIGKGLIANNNLTHLNLALSGLNVQACQRLAVYLGHNNSVTNLNLSHNIIGDQGLEFICNMLNCNTTIKYITLEYCNLSQESGRYLASMLKINTKLKGLIISNNSLGNEGALLLSEGLQVNQSLFYLNIDQNRISNTGFFNIIESIKFHPSLKNLSIKELTQLLSPSNQDKLLEIIENNSNLKAFGLDYNFNGWEHIYSKICKQFTKKITKDYYTINAVTTALYYTRCLLLTKPYSSTDLDPVLPDDLLIEIVKRIDKYNMLNSVYWGKILKFATDKRTIGESRDYYLSEVLTNENFENYKFNEESNSRNNYN